MRARTLIPVLLIAATVLAACTSQAADDPAVTVTTTMPPTSGGASSSGAVVTVPPSGGAASSGSSAGGTASGGPSTSAPASSTPSTSTPSTSKPSTSKTPTSAPSTSTSSTAPSSPSDGRPAGNVPMKKLKPGEKPPQFVIFSFDGAGNHDKWVEFSAAAKKTDSHFVGFLSGIYLIATENKDVYTGPGHSPGTASIGFGGSKEEIVTEIEDLNRAYAAGHEIGTHYNGHFCAGNEPSGKDWSTADWDSELAQFMGFLTDYKKLNGWGDEVPDLKVTPEDIKGGRTPCLEGALDALAPAWKKHDLTYDSSLTFGTGIVWPDQRQGIWEFPMPYIYSPGFDSMVMAMDYNFWFKFNQGAEQPETAPELRQIVRQTYDYMYDQAYNGNRAPVLIANHFNVWNGDSFNPPALDFMQETCGKKDTYCTTYQDVIAWMELQDPAVLKQLQEQPAVATGP